MSWVKPAEHGDGRLTDYLVRLSNGKNVEFKNITKDENIHLSQLKPYTLYLLRVQAGNKHGYGRNAEITFKTRTAGKKSLIWDVISTLVIRISRMLLGFDSDSVQLLK